MRTAGDDLGVNPRRNRQSFIVNGRMDSHDCMMGFRVHLNDRSCIWARVANESTTFQLLILSNAKKRSVRFSALIRTKRMAQLCARFRKELMLQYCRSHGVFPVRFLCSLTGPND